MPVVLDGIAFEAVGVDDAARAMILAAERGRNGERYLVSDSMITNAEVVRIAAEAAGAAVTALPANAAEYGRRLYATLRQLDAAGHDLIIVEAPPAAPEWLAVHDRLMRAAHRD